MVGDDHELLVILAGTIEKPNGIKRWTTGETKRNHFSPLSSTKDNIGTAGVVRSLQIPMPTFHSNDVRCVSIQAVQAAIRSLFGLLVTHSLFVKDDINHGMLVEISEPVASPIKISISFVQKNKLKQESVLKLRTWLGMNSLSLRTKTQRVIGHLVTNQQVTTNSNQPSNLQGHYDCTTTPNLSSKRILVDYKVIAGGFIRG